VIGLKRQTDIYLGGASGARPKVPVDPDKLEAKARRAMSRQAYAYIGAGAGSKATMRANRAAFDRWRIVPRMLRDVSVRDTGIDLFGRRLPSPFLLAPIGVLELAHSEADLAVARAAAAEGVPMIFSNQASTAMEDCAKELGDSPRWFQLYWSTENELVESFVGRAEACGCEAIVVTLDTTILGWRPGDLDPAFLPFVRGQGIAQYTSDPVFTRLMGQPGDGNGDRPDPKPTPAALRTLVQLTRRYPDRFTRTLTSGRGRAAVQRFTEIYSRPSLAWKDLAFLRERTKLPILLKGVLHPDDAVQALDHGVNGIVVSNHGGRQVDGAIASFEALPRIVDAIGGRVPVLIDSGVRGGADAFKALALGANAVLVGRPYVFGLAAGGEEGVREVLQNLMAEFDLTMGLSGCKAVDEIDRGALVHESELR
jgi:isopentenyl diphosphate isomerase/L-lactate dehydrogenase-like FMN-dependent dehydrogenase